MVAEQSKFGDDVLKEVCILRLFKCFTGHTGSPQQYSKACLYVFQNISTNWKLGLTKVFARGSWGESLLDLISRESKPKMASDRFY